MKIVNITSDRIKAYIKMRLEQGAANSTINRELKALSRMLNLGAEQTQQKRPTLPFKRLYHIWL